MKKLLLACSITVLMGILLSVFLLKRVEPFYSLSLRVSDFNYSIHSEKLSDDVILILVDEKSINRFGRWPWNREIFAKGLEKLKSAKVVALDMVFSEKTNEKDDAYLAKTIEGMEIVVCGFFIRKKATENPPEELIDILSDSALFRVPEVVPFPNVDYVEVNIPEITESCLLSGTFNAISDPDGNFRRYPLGFVFGGNVYPSVGVQVLRAYTGRDVVFKGNSLQVGNYTIPMRDDGTVILNFYPLRDYQKNSFSFVDLYEGKVPMDRISGKVVIVGISEAGVTDIRATPIGLVPGPYLHVTFVSNALQGELLVDSIPLTILFLFFSSLLLSLFYFLLQPGIRIPLYFFLFALVFVIACFFYLYMNTVIYDLFIYIDLLLLSVGFEAYDSFLKHKQAKFYKGVFSTYVSPEVLEEIVENPEKLKLGGEKREITVLFSDIRGFTSLSEKLSPDRLVKLLNTYLTPMTDIVLKNRGMLDKYIGDAIMAIWNAPMEIEDHREKALITGFEMIKKLNEVNKILKQEDFPEIKIGIGINTGEAVVGNMGSEKRFEYTAIGDTVNLASRLEGLNKLYMMGETGVLTSEFTALPVKDKDFPFLIIEVDMVRVKGKKKPVRIFTLLEKGDKTEEIKEVYEKALSLYREVQFKEALKLFSKIEFNPAKVMAERCRELLQNPPEEWDGVYTAKTK
ncbi:CHASE2 domain-containing protein [Desulfurobacterium crinifex]